MLVSHGRPLRLYANTIQVFSMFRSRVCNPPPPPQHALGVEGFAATYYGGALSRDTTILYWSVKCCTVKSNNRLHPSYGWLVSTAVQKACCKIGSYTHAAVCASPDSTFSIGFYCSFLREIIAGQTPTTSSTPHLLVDITGKLYAFMRHVTLVTSVLQ